MLRIFQQIWHIYCLHHDALTQINISGAQEGTVELYTHRVLEALVAIKNEVIVWPTADEKQVIMAEFEKLTGAPYMIGALDGSLFEIWQKPGWDGGDFISRKDTYRTRTP